jgi:hypothetical protein
MDKVTVYKYSMIWQCAGGVFFAALSLFLLWFTGGAELPKLIQTKVMGSVVLDAMWKFLLFGFMALYALWHTLNTEYDLEAEFDLETKTIRVVRRNMGSPSRTVTYKANEVKSISARDSRVLIEFVDRKALLLVDMVLFEQKYTGEDFAKELARRLGYPVRTVGYMPSNEGN